MNGFALKIIALTAMIIDHTGKVLPDIFPFEILVIGRIAFPIYVFLIAEGFYHTKNPVRFLVRLFTFAIISESFFDMALNGAYFSFGADGINFFANTNIFYTLFLGGAAITCYEYVRRKCHFVESDIKITSALAAVTLMLGFAWLVGSAFTSDYGGYGVVFIFCMYLLRKFDLPKGFILTAMAVLSLWQYEWMFVYALTNGLAAVTNAMWLAIAVTLVPVPLAACYNGKRGPGWKWFFYWSYPAHLAVLAVVLVF
ncbi:MAG: conjugal transfer protein TraX [Firmicutes bacterium]|nr:conjugal transfer protein TraX [Bacillota bacterium]